MSQEDKVMATAAVGAGHITAGSEKEVGQIAVGTTVRTVFKSNKQPKLVIVGSGEFLEPTKLDGAKICVMEIPGCYPGIANGSEGLATIDGDGIWDIDFGQRKICPLRNEIAMTFQVIGWETKKRRKRRQ